MIAAARVTSPLTLSTLGPLLWRAFRYFGVDPERGLEELKAGLRDPLWGFFVVWEADRPVGAGLIQLPHSVFEPKPFIQFLYCEGSRAATKAITAAAMAFIKASGNTTFRATNLSGRSDAAWARMTGRKESRKIGSYMEFSVE